MNYTQTIRNYISERKGGFFEITYERKKYFHMIPDKTLMKVLNRLEDEGLLLSIAKGLYFINDGTEYSNDKLIEYYDLKDRGIATGYVLLNNLLDFLCIQYFHHQYIKLNLLILLIFQLKQYHLF